jgi:hypothetical protein
MHTASTLRAADALHGGVGLPGNTRPVLRVKVDGAETCDLVPCRSPQSRGPRYRYFRAPDRSPRPTTWCPAWVNPNGFGVRTLGTFFSGSSQHPSKLLSLAARSRRQRLNFLLLAAAGPVLDFFEGRLPESDILYTPATLSFLPRIRCFCIPNCCFPASRLLELLLCSIAPHLSFQGKPNPTSGFVIAARELSPATARASPTIIIGRV